MGLGTDEILAASDPLAIGQLTNEFIFLDDGDVAEISAETYLKWVNYLASSIGLTGVAGGQYLDLLINGQNVKVDKLQEIKSDEATSLIINLGNLTEDNNYKVTFSHYYEGSDETVSGLVTGEAAGEISLFPAVLEFTASENKQNINTILVYQLDCAGNPNGNAYEDECGVSNGDNSTCLDECGVPNGDNSSCTDECGIINGNGPNQYEDCDGNCLNDEDNDNICDETDNCVGIWVEDIISVSYTHLTLPTKRIV